MTGQAPAAHRIAPHSVLLACTIVSVTVLAAMAAARLLHPGWIGLPLTLYVVVCGFAAAEIRADFYLRSIHRGTSTGAVALTFDDGPHPAGTAQILDVLREKGVKATFFLIGSHAAAEPELVRRMVDEGHIVGNHSFHHSFHFDWQSAERMAVEIRKTDALLESLAGRQPRLFRPPYGVTNPMLAKALRRTKHFSIGWSVRSLDTRIRDPHQLLKRIFSQLKGGDILLLHDHVPVTASILTAIIDEGRERGFTFVPLDQLIPVSPYVQVV